MSMTSDNGRAMTDAERDEFLTSGRLFAKIATTTPDGWPVVSPVWYAWDGASFLVVSKPRAGLVQNLRRDPRCGVLVDNVELPYKRVAVQGEVEFLPHDFDWRPATRDMVLRYLGPGGMEYAESTFGFERAPFKVWPRRMTTWNGGGFDRTFRRPTVWHEVSS